MPYKHLKVKETKRGLQITTPAGRAGFVALDVPSTKFKPEGEYSIALLLDSKSAECKELVATLDEMLRSSEQEALIKKGKKKVKVADPPYKAEEDDDGVETGNIKFNFKLPAKYIKYDENDNVMDTFEFRPGKFDARGNILDSKIRIGAGSTVKVCFEASPYYTDGLGAGVKNRLKSVQLLELVEPGGGVSFEGSGFDVEDGFDAKSAQASDETESPSGDEADF